MPLPDSVFRYVPELRGKLLDPEKSKLRLSLDDFKTIDAKARANGQPKNWRISHEAREANRKAALVGRLDSDLWIFAYGSLIWDPSIRIDQLRRARIKGWRRRFCLDLKYSRGSQDEPGLMLALDSCDADGFCDGVAMRIPAERADTESEFLWRREMMTGTYNPKFLHTETPQGPIESLAFCANRDHPRYLDLPEAEVARRIARASGPLGRDIDYLEALVADLDALNIADPMTRDLLDRARADLPQRSS